MLVMRDVMVAKGVVAAGSRAREIAKIQHFRNDPVLFEGYAKHARIPGFRQGKAPLLTP